MLPQAHTLSKLCPMEIGPVEAKPLRFPPGRFEIRLDDRQRQAYRQLYQKYQSFLTGMPVLRERDFDGRPIRVTGSELGALNAAFARLNEQRDSTSVFGNQEEATTRLFKKTQYLS